MTEPTRRFEIDLPSGLTVAHLGGLLVALQPALLTTIRALAKQHGNKPGPWLDELEKDLVSHANIVAEGGAAAELETTKQMATALLQSAVDIVRDELIAAENK
ncbi:hypothetical protein BN1110_03718 [bacterium YEK0313]|nr:hypothetical protein BN1110_03718 [bacterium YEK0313]